MRELLVQMNWQEVGEVIRAIAAVVTVVIAFLSVLVTRDQFRKQKKRETSTAYYGVLVRDPGMQNVRDLRSSLMSRADLCKNFMSSADTSGSNDVMIHTRSLLDETRKQITDVRDELLIGANAWGDGDLVNALRVVFEKMEDNVSAMFASLLLDGDRDAEDVTNGLAEVLRILKNHDPGLRS